MYTGDWWWNIPARRWNGASLTPYLWAAPSVGYLSTYPGDQSPYWKADYGGWSERCVLQYAVGPIPGAGGGNSSVVTTLRASRLRVSICSRPAVV